MDQAKTLDLEIAIVQELQSTKHRLSELSDAFERRDDFIRWLVEVKLEDEYSLNELWNEYETYESNQ